MPRAVDLGIANYGERASREEATQIAIALLADTPKLVFAPLQSSCGDCGLGQNFLGL